MTNKTITLDRELVSRIVGLRPDYTCAQLDADEELVRAALADPVPPAGGKPDPIIAVLKGHLADGMNPMFSGGDLKHLIGLLEAGTRLQAEVERLKLLADKRWNDLTEESDKSSAEIYALQAELTKARELIEQKHDALRVAETYVQSAFSRAQLKDKQGRKLPPAHPISADLSHILAALSIQSAPADKGQGEPVAKAKPVAKLHAERLSGKDGEYGITVEDTTWFNQCRMAGGIFNLYAEQPAPVAVSLPERKTVKAGLLSESNTHNQGWNACLDEFTRLNSEPKP